MCRYAPTRGPPFSAGQFACTTRRWPHVGTLGGITPSSGPAVCDSPRSSGLAGACPASPSFFSWCVSGKVSFVSPSRRPTQLRPVAASDHMRRRSAPGARDASDVRVRARRWRVRFARGSFDKLRMTEELRSPEISRMGHNDVDRPLRRGRSGADPVSRAVWSEREQVRPYGFGNVHYSSAFRSRGQPRVDPRPSAASVTIHARSSTRRPPRASTCRRDTMERETPAGKICDGLRQMSKYVSRIVGMCSAL
jgi:hypothetical protein